jgi:homocysteine S-methyltransferase
MVIRYEINPPKISDYGNASRDILFERIKTINSVCDGIHLTDSVLGVPRVSPFEIAKQIREFNKKIKLTCSLRIVDKDLNTVEQIVQQSIGVIDSILIIMGDKSDIKSNSENLIPSQVVKTLNDNGLGKKIKLFLSLPSNPNFIKIQKKIDARPVGFFTQVINSKNQIQRMVDYLEPKGFKIIPCLLFPSEKNSKSAKFLNIDWSSYKDNFILFVNEIHNLTHDILVTSPNDFKGAKTSLSKIAS